MTTEPMTHQDVLHVIDGHLKTMSGRQSVGTLELADILLDIRNNISTLQAQMFPGVEGIVEEDSTPKVIYAQSQ